MTSRAFHIVCAVDLSEFSPAVIEHALDEANRHADVLLHFITVLEEGKGIFSHKAPTEEELLAADNSLRFMVAETLPAFVDTATVRDRMLRFHTRAGKPEEEIIELASESRAERVVVGRHGGKVRKGKMGSIANLLVQAAPCTVLVVQLSDYEGIHDDYDRCPDCAHLREVSTDGAWFCTAHLDGRSKRLARSRVRIGAPTPGWGVH